jgi:hypothetical protein
MMYSLYFVELKKKNVCTLQIRDVALLLVWTCICSKTRSIIPRHSKKTSYIVKVSIHMVKVFMYMVQFSIYMIYVLLDIDTALKTLYNSSYTW